MHCEGKNTYIIDKKPSRFEEIELANGTLTVPGADGESLAPGTITREQIYCVLYADKLRNLTLVLRAPKPCVVTMIFSEDATFDAVMQAAQKEFPDLKFSWQNEKINSYAGNIAEKLESGVELLVVDAVREDEIEYCPECGVQVEPGMPYCMECGAEL